MLDGGAARDHRPSFPRYGRSRCFAVSRSCRPSLKMLNLEKGVRLGPAPRIIEGQPGALCAGIDVSLENASLCVIDATGRIVREAKVAGSSPKHQFGSSAELERRLKRSRCGTTANKHAHFSIDKCVEVRYACCALALRVLSTSIGGIGDDQSASRPRVGYCRQEDRKRTFRAQAGCAAASEITGSSARSCIGSALSSLRAGL